MKIMFIGILACLLIVCGMSLSPADEPGGGILCWYDLGLIVHIQQGEGTFSFYSRIIGNPCGNVYVNYSTNTYDEDDNIIGQWNQRGWYDPDEPFSRPFEAGAYKVKLTVIGVCDNCGNIRVRSVEIWA